jgi:hypothetical protein
MAAVLSGHTATMVITNSLVLKIQLIDQDRLFYQFLDVADEKAYDIVEAEIASTTNDEDELDLCFYLSDDEQKDTPYYLSEFIRDNYPQIAYNISQPLVVR